MSGFLKDLRGGKEEWKYMNTQYENDWHKRLVIGTLRPFLSSSFTRATDISGVFRANAENYLDHGQNKKRKCAFLRLKAPLCLFFYFSDFYRLAFFLCRGFQDRIHLKNWVPIPPYIVQWGGLVSQSRGKVKHQTSSSPRLCAAHVGFIRTYTMCLSTITRDTRVAAGGIITLRQWRDGDGRWELKKVEDQ